MILSSYRTHAWLVPVPVICLPHQRKIDGCLPAEPALRCHLHHMARWWSNYRTQYLDFGSTNWTHYVRSDLPLRREDRSYFDWQRVPDWAVLVCEPTSYRISTNAWIEAVHSPKPHLQLLGLSRGRSWAYPHCTAHTNQSTKRGVYYCKLVKGNKAIEVRHWYDIILTKLLRLPASAKPCVPNQVSDSLRASVMGCLPSPSVTRMIIVRITPSWESRRLSLGIRKRVFDVDRFFSIDDVWDALLVPLILVVVESAVTWYSDEEKTREVAK